MDIADNENPTAQMVPEGLYFGGMNQYRPSPEELEQERANERKSRRAEALHFASTIHKGVATDPAEVLEDAAKYYAYIMGEEDAGQSGTS